MSGQDSMGTGDRPAGDGDAGATGDAPAGGGDGGARDGERATLPPLEPERVAGTRLRPRVWITSDGDTLFVNASDPTQPAAPWADTALGIDCMFLRSTDGVVRCLPTGSRLTAAYIDPACSVPAFLSAQGIPIRYYLGQSRSSACAETLSRVWELLGEPLPPPQTVYGDTGAGCQPRSPPTMRPDQSWHRAELAPFSRFVSAREVTEAVTADLSVVVYVADDGARERARLATGAGNQGCRPTSAAGGTRCLPPPAALVSSTIFEATTCSGPTVLVGEACPGPSPIAASRAVNQTACDSEQALTVYALGAMLAADRPVSQRSASQSCDVIYRPADAAPLFATGAMIPLESFPPLERIQRGRGRGKQVYWAAPGGAGVVRAEDYYYDSSLQAICVLFEIPPGGPRYCVPSVQLFDSDNFFKDASCTVPLYRITGSSCPRDPQPLAGYLGSPDQMFRLSAPYAGGLVYVQPGRIGPCMAYAGGSPGGVPLYEAEPLPLEQLLSVRPATL